MSWPRDEAGRVDITFEWDEAKAASNRSKHGIDFELATRVWDDPLRTIVLDRVQDGEVRWHAFGSVKGMILLVVVHTYPDADDEGLVRIISARKADRHEKRAYQEQAL